MNSYIKAFLKKLDYYFNQKEIAAIIYLQDGEDNETLDQVIFLEKEDNGVVGLYVNGMNPLLSQHRVHEIDDFNLFASYDTLIESRENFKLSLARIHVFFSTAYNECLGFYLANMDDTNALVILFLQDEIDVKKMDCKATARSIIEKKWAPTDFVTYEKLNMEEWKQIRF